MSQSTLLTVFTSQYMSIHYARHMTIMREERRSAMQQHAHILLVEDDEVLRELVLRNLQVRGHVVNMAENAEQALTQLRTTSFDLVILDINLPDRTGWDVLRIAQREGCLTLQSHNEHGQTLPVVVLSAVRVSPTRLAEFHPLAYLPKPFPMDALLRLAAESACQ